MLNREKIPVILIAGGKGERLSPLTKKIPKPMIKIGRKPILEYILLMFKSQGFRHLVFCLCYKKDKIKAYFKEGKKWGVQIKYLFEDEKKPLGTAGALGLAKSYIQGTFIVCYGDILREINLAAMLNLHFKKKALATINLYQNLSEQPKSEVKLNKSSKVVQFKENPGKVRSKIIWSNGSLYIFEPSIFQDIQSNQFQDFSKDIFPELIKKKKKLYGYISKDYFIDISNTSKLKQAKKDLVSGKFKPYDFS